MADSFGVHITIPGDTVAQLQKNKFQLYGFKAVNASSSGAPVVWFSTRRYSASTRIDWVETHGAYTSTVTPVAGAVITASAFCPAVLGDEVTVAEGGLVSVTGRGPDSRGIAIQNGTIDTFTCGITQFPPSLAENPRNAEVPICAFTLLPSSLDLIIPVKKVLLLFASEQLDTGTVLERSFSWGALIDLTHSPSHEVSANYDLTRPTQWEPTPEVAPVKPGDALQPLLVGPDIGPGRPRVSAG